MRLRQITVGGGAATSIAPGTPIGDVTPGSGAFTTLSATDGLTVQGTNVGGTWLGLFSQDGITTENSIISSAQNKMVSVQGDGAAYFMGRDVTNNIEFIVGTSNLGTAFVGSMTAHDLQLRASNVTRMTINASTGAIGVGVSGTAVLHLKAGAAGAGLAPFKFTSGALNTVPEPGAEEFLANDRYYTGTDGTRRTYATKNNTFTVAGLPAGVQGDKAYVSDASSPTYNAAVVGGGTVFIEVLKNATTWVCS